MEQKKPGIARRAAVGVGKAWAYSLGITSLAREFGRIGGNVAAGGGFVRRKLADGPQNYRNETFQEAIERLDLDEEHLVRQARVFSTRAWSWFASMMLATAWLARISISNAPWSHALLCFGLIGMSFAKSITWRFRFCQVRDRELYSFGPWFFNTRRW